MKYIAILLALLSLQSCEKDSAPGEKEQEKKKVKLYIWADPGIYQTGNPVAIQISGTNIKTVDNVTSGYIIEAEYPVGEAQTVTIKPVKGSPFMHLHITSDLNDYNLSATIAKKSGEGILTATFYPEDIESPVTPAREEAGQIVINEVSYPVVEIGTQLWTTRDYSGYRNGIVNYDSSDTIINNGRHYTIEEAQTIALPAGWRIPSSQDLQKMRTASGSSLSNIMLNDKWHTATTNSSKLSLYPTFKNGTNRLFNFYLLNNTDAYTAFSISQDPGRSVSFGSFTGSIAGLRTSLRFVKDK